MAETAGIHLRETRAHAREIKFVVDRARGLDIQAWMRANLAPDEFGSGAEHDQFETSSLYFETRVFDVFHRRASYGKSKYRIRRYGASPIMFLERKFRTDNRQVDHLAFGKCRERGRIAGADIRNPGDAGDASIAGRAHHFADGRLGSQFPGKGVLAPAIADHQHFHDAVTKLN